MSEFQTREDVAEVRQDLAETWRDVLDRLRQEIRVHKKLPESLIKNLKITSDQLRIEFRSSTAQVPDEEAIEDVAPQDPLEGLRVVDGDAA